MRVTRISLIVIAIPLLFAAGCTTYDSAVPGGTAIGAGAGALIGYGLTGSGLGAAAGAGAGALAGALTGVAIDESNRRRMAPPPPPPSPRYEQPPPRYERAPQTYSPPPDPTRGALVNETRWRLEIFLDDAREAITLRAGQGYPLYLDIGGHRIAAMAYVSTQFGERLVGTYRHSIYIDPKGSGWSLRFNQNMF